MDRDWQQPAPGDEAGRRQLRAVVAPGREAADLRVEHRTTRRGGTSTSISINLDGSGLERVTFNDTFDGVPDVFAGREAPGVRVQPQREGGR